MLAHALICRAWIVASLLLALSCGPRGKTHALDGAASGTSVMASVGDQMDVTLQTIGPGEYAAPGLSSSAVRYLGVSLVGPAIPAGPTQRFVFEVVATGSTEIVIPHTSQGPTFRVVVVVS